MEAPQTAWWEESRVGGRSRETRYIEQSSLLLIFCMYAIWNTTSCVNKVGQWAIKAEKVNIIISYQGGECFDKDGMVFMVGCWTSVGHQVRQGQSFCKNQLRIQYIYQLLHSIVWFLYWLLVLLTIVPTDYWSYWLIVTDYWSFPNLLNPCSCIRSGGWMSKGSRLDRLKTSQIFSLDFRRCVFCPYWRKFWEE